MATTISGQNGPSVWNGGIIMMPNQLLGTNKTRAATNDGRAIATEAQVFLKADISSPVLTGSPRVGADRLAVVAASGSHGETNLPIGSYILVIAGASPPARNHSLIPRLGATTSQYTTSGAGAALSGTWRSGGDTGLANANNVISVRRVG